MNLFSCLSRALVAACLTLLAAPALAQPSFATAEAEVEHRLTSVLDAIYQPIEGDTVAQQEARVRATMEATFSYEAMVRRSFGRHWNSLRVEDQNALRELLVRLLVRSYLERFGASARPTLTYRPAIVLAPGRLEVPSSATLEGQTFSIAYRMLERDGKREVYDVVIEGVSLVGNYREQIDAHFQRGNAAGLIEKLERQLAEVSKSTPPTP